ncbi:MAG TPA: ATP-binding protein [Oculatellaceae cyanobacterium]
MEKIVGSTHSPYLVSDTSHIGSLRRAAKELALINGLPSEAIGRAELIATEIATNLIKHVQNGGEVLLGSLEVDGIKGLEILALDKGRGMADTEQMLRDGISTVGTLGGGLGAIKRLSDEFDIHSQLGSGTVLLARVWAATSVLKWQANGVQIGGVIVAQPGQEVSGDRWAVRYDQGTITILVADGLGHGQRAALAAEESIRVFFESPSAQPAPLLRRMHEALQHTQGAAAAIAQVDRIGGTITYSGIGNIAGRVHLPGELRGCVSMPGGLGFQLTKVQEFIYSWTEQTTLLLNSDGLKSAITMDGLSKHHSSLIAASLYRDFRRGTDDATIVVAKDRRINQQ